MKIVFIYPDMLFHRRDWGGYYYVGLASMSAALKQKGHETSLFHITNPVKKHDFMKRVVKEDPDLIGFSSTTQMFPFVEKYASWLVKLGIDAPTICGGIHPTIAPEEVINVEGIDMICRGEGEHPLVELCGRMENKEDISNIQNIWLRKNGGIVKNHLRPLISDLNTLLLPDRSIFDVPNLYNEREGRGSLMVSRGCPYDCTYCCNPLLRRIYGNEGKAIRFRSVDNVMAEIKALLERYPFIRSLTFDDDILFVKKTWAEEFAEKYSKEIGIPFVCNCRADLTDEIMVKLLKKAGCCHVRLGLESGNEYIGNEILNRRLKNEHIKKAFALCKEAGLMTETFNMVGVPYETPGAVLDTVKLNATIGVDRMQVSIFQPYKGTKLADLCQEQNFLSSKNMGSDFFSYSVLKLNTISPSQVLMFRDYFRVFVRYYGTLQKLPAGISGPLTRISDTILSLRLTARLLNLTYVALNYVFRRLQSLGTKISVALRRAGSPKVAATRSEA